MKLSYIAALASLAADAHARLGAHPWLAGMPMPHDPRQIRGHSARQPNLEAREQTEPRFLDDKTSKFAVNGSGIPLVDFDVGESYSGLLPISDDPEDEQKLFFWFFPTVNEEHKDDKEIVIWLNGGPGCSSLVGLLQENGPFLWQPGTLKPQPNPWSWHLLSNIVWIEQPVATGYSTGPVTITGEDGLVDQFLGFWKNFMETFGMQGYKIYIAAESYGGVYGPYIGSGMIEKNDTEYFDMQGLLIYDGLIGDTTQVVQRDAATWYFAEQHRSLMPFDDELRANFSAKAESCGFTDYLHQNLKFPPPEKSPLLPPATTLLPNGTIEVDQSCMFFYGDLYYAMLDINPCFDLYNIASLCPPLFDPLPLFSPDENAVAYFDRTDVKEALHATIDAKWESCNTQPFNTSDGLDTSPTPDLYQLPHVIDTTENVIIVNGALDMVLDYYGSLLAIQNMTWGGQRGFQSAPADPFYVPRYNGSEYASNLPTGSGVLGTTHYERGMTWVGIALAGHEVPEYAPGAAIRHLEKLLGRVDSMSDTAPYTLPGVGDVPQQKGSLGKGTVKVPCFSK